MWSTRLSKALPRRSLPSLCISRPPPVSAARAAFPALHRPLCTARTLSSAAATVLQTTLPPEVPATGLPDDLPIASMDDRRVAVGWDTRTWSRFHHIWLRDHCRCPTCCHSATKQRLVDTFAILPDIKPVQVNSKPEGLEVIWHEVVPHVSLYPWSWLRANSYDPPANYVASEKILWGAKIAQAPPTVAYEETLDERGVWKWLSNVDRFGFSFVTGVPPTPEATEALARRIGFIRETQYGTFWDFTSDLSKGDTAYTTLALSAHTDNTYFTDPSGLQLFHLLSHTAGTGGATLLVDGFYTAALLASLHPSLHAALARVPVAAHAAGEVGALYRPKRGAPVLEYASGDTGEAELLQVRWNNHDRSALRGAGAAVQEWYEAARVWNRLLTSADSEYWVQLQPGTAVVIDNHRVLHGRSAFTGARRMCGAYIGWDEYRSRLAVLNDRFASKGGDGDTGVWSANF